MPAKKAAKSKSVTKEIKELKDQHVLEKSDTKRERKSPTRFSVAIPPPNTRELVIPNGRGTALGSISAISSELSKRKMDDPTLMTLHHLAYGMSAKRMRVKSNLRQFSGVKYDAKLDRAKLEQRIGARPHAVLRNVCNLLQLSSGGSTAELVYRIADFLERPSGPEKKSESKKRVRAAPAAKKPAAKKPATKAAPAKKASPKKSATKKPAAEKKPAEKKPAEKKPAEKKPAEKKPAEKKPAEKKPAEKKADEKKPAEKKPAEKKPTVKKPAEKKPAEKKTEEKPAESKPEEKPVEKKPAEKKGKTDKAEKPAAKPKENKPATRKSTTKK